MTPNQLSKSGTEHAHQVALFAWAAIACYHGFKTANLWADNGVIPSEDFTRKPIHCLKWLHAIHNQGHGDAIRGGKAKAEGVKAGIPDIFLPYSTKGKNGLYIELKRPEIRPVHETSKGGLSNEQIEFAAFAKANGFEWRVAYGWHEAAKIIQEYLA